MADNGGYIYVLTNPSFPEYVKIGYADNVDERVTQLNRTECTPFAFKKYAVLHVASRLADKNVHKLIDKFKPELRAKENVNGKMRIREFFAMSAKEAVEILDTIGSIYGESPVIFEQTIEEKKDEQLAEETAIASERKSPFSFYKCGIQNGEQVVYVHDTSIVCTVASDREILFNGKKTSLSALAKKLLNRKCSVQGTLHFTYKGEVLSALRKRLEDEGEYVLVEESKFSTNIDTIKTTITDDAVLLYFTMEKYPATCKWTKDGYLLLKGSKISSGFTASCKDWVKTMRKNNEDKISSEYILVEDILFKSSSSAAAFITGSSKNGKIYWKDENGTLLKDLLRKGE